MARDQCLSPSYWRSVLFAIFQSLRSDYKGRYTEPFRLQGLSRFETLAGFFRGSAARFNHLASCLSNGQIQIIALQIQSIAVLLDVMRLFRLSD